MSLRVYTSNHSPGAEIEVCVADDRGGVLLTLCPEDGEQGVRWRELTPEEARALGAMLTHYANEAER